MSTRLKFAHLLTQLARDIKFFWQPHKIAAGGSNWGAMYRCPDHFLSKIGEWKPSILIGSEPLRIKVELSTVSLKHLVSPVAKARRTSDKKIRLHFLLTKTLVHELGHFIFCYARKHGNYLGEPHLGELYMLLTNFMPEVGASWESRIFGGRLSVEDSDTTGIGMITTSKWSDCYMPLKTSYPVSTHWLQGWFSQRLWENGRYPGALQFETPPYFQVKRYISMKRTRYSKGPGRDTVFSKNEVGTTMCILFSFLKQHPFLPLKVFGVPPLGADIEQWYAELLESDKQLSISEGISVPHAGSWGGYSRLRTSRSAYLIQQDVDTADTEPLHPSDSGIH